MGCQSRAKQLPILGKPQVIGKDTIYPIIADFNFIDQDSNQVTNQTFSNKIYVADFIFLSCPTICPRLTKAMYTAYLPFATDDRVAFLSHSIDPERDTIPRLKLYSNNLGVQAAKWHFVTGNADSIFKIANESYFSAAYPDSSAPGGFTHSGGMLLIDKQKHIRGVYNSNNSSETTRLISDIQTLLKEQF